MEEAVICVDGTHPFSDKNRIAFAALPSRADDPKVAKVKSCIGKVNIIIIPIPIILRDRMKTGPIEWNRIVKCESDQVQLIG